MMVGSMKANLVRTCLAILPLLASSACSDDDEGPPPFRTSVAENNAQAEAQAAELSDAQKRKLCDEYGAHVSANVDLNKIAYAVCLPTSLLFGGFTEESCNAYLNDCVGNFVVTGNVSAKLYDQRACIAGLDRCDLNVVELEGCVNVNLNLVYSILERLSCRRAGDADLEHEIDGLTTAAVCSQPTRTCLGDSQVIF